MENKRAIIIGATSGIGLETAKLLLSDGWTLGIAGRREDRLLIEVVVLFRVLFLMWLL